MMCLNLKESFQILLITLHLADGCFSPSSPPPPPSPTQAPTPAPTQGPTDPCSGGQSVVKNPNDPTCTTYIQCAHGVAHVMNCPSGLVFNPAGYCDWPYNYNCDGGGAVTTNPPITAAPTTAGPTTAAPPTPAPTTPSPPGPCGKKFVCYYPNWAYWRQGDGNFKVDNIDPHLCTHVVYSFAVLDTANFGLKAHDTWLVCTNFIGGHEMHLPTCPLIIVSLPGFG